MNFHILSVSTSNWNSVTITTFVMSLSSFMWLISWQIYTYIQNNKIKLDILPEYLAEEIGDSDEYQDYVSFTIVNHSNKKALIKSIEREFIVDYTKPYYQPDIEVKYGKDESLIYPIIIEPSDIYKYRIEFKKDKESFSIQINTKETDIVKAITSKSYVSKSCRIRVVDVKGKEFTSKWMNYKEQFFN